MAGKALLIGAATGGLAGVPNDVAVMADVLAGRGFSVLRRLGRDASRAGILSAYAGFIEDARPGDAAVVYYSGHGGLARVPSAGRAGGEQDLRFIVPTDYRESAPDAAGFRGITSIELSALLARLTAKTGNATMVFDCCHAGRMVRAGQNWKMRIRALARPASYAQVRAHIDRLRIDGVVPLDPGRAEGSPSAVRVVACAPEQSAYEYEGEAGLRIGVFTEALAKYLGEAGPERVTWAQLMDRVRDRVLRLAPGQRPEAEGPSRRLLFDRAEDDPLTSLRVTPIGSGRVRLECASLLGVARGDVFALTPPGALGPDDANAVGEVRIDRVGPITAEGPLLPARGRSHLPPGTRAHRISKVPSAFPVLLPGGDAGPDIRELKSRVSASPLLRVAEPDEAWLAAVRVGGTGELTVEDRLGPLHGPRPSGAEAASQVLGDLHALAHASRVRGLGASTDSALGAPVTFEVTQASPARSTVSISVRNDAEYVVYVSLVRVGGHGRAEVLTDFAPSGVRLGPAEHCDYDFDEVDAVHPAYLRPVTLLLLVTAQAQDVSALANGGVGRNRDLNPGSGQSERYDAHTFVYLPALRPARATFLLEERPRHVVLRNAARVRVPGTVAVTLERLIVHEVPVALGADLRLDVFVRTQGAYAARTLRLPLDQPDQPDRPDRLDRLPVYRGPARELVELAVWVSRRVPGVRDLSELLPPGPEPSVDAAFLALRDAVHDVIGVYRGVLVAREYFGAGRHPESGTRRVLDFSFAYRVD